MDNPRNCFTDQRGVTVLYDMRITALLGFVGIALVTLYQAADGRVPFVLPIVMGSLALAIGIWIHRTRNGQHYNKGE
jgi:hypothetical protein